MIQRHHDDCCRPQTEPHVSDRMLLDALARGGKDEVVARRLGVSPRTLRRRMTDLMRRLGATSRFQAGVFAAQSGIIAQPADRGQHTPGGGAP